VHGVRSDILQTLNADQAAYAKDLFQQCNDNAHDLVAKHWTAIDAVAKALLSRPVLNGDGSKS
jgi:hypothetical protein